MRRSFFVQGFHSPHARFEAVENERLSALAQRTVDCALRSYWKLRFFTLAWRQVLSTSMRRSWRVAGAGRRMTGSSGEVSIPASSAARSWGSSLSVGLVLFGEEFRKMFPLASISIMIGKSHGIPEAGGPTFRNFSGRLCPAQAMKKRRRTNTTSTIGAIWNPKSLSSLAVPAIMFCSLGNGVGFTRS